MTIAFDAKRMYHNHRGLGNYSRDVLRLMTTYAPENKYLLYAKPSNCYSFAQATTIQPTGLWRAFPALWRSFGCIHALDGVDIYHGLSGEIPIGIKAPTKTVVTIHDAIFIRYPELYSPTYRSLFRRKVQYACNHADRIVAISQQTKQDVIEFFHADSQKIQVVYQGCNNMFRKPISKKSIEAAQQKYNLPEAFILCVGAIEPRKNLANLIRAVAAAKIDLPIVALGGFSKYARTCMQLANELKVDLMLKHNVPFSDFPAIYKAAQVMVYPSLFEGFGIPILEAMCVGIPVLTSEGSCFAETGGEAALYANPTQPEHIGEQLQRILSDTNLRQTMIAAGHAQAEKFTDERVAQNLIHMYTTL